MENKEQYIELFGWETELEKVDSKSKDNLQYFKILDRIGHFKEISILDYGNTETPYLLEFKDIDTDEYKYSIGDFENDGRFVSVIDWISPSKNSLIKTTSNISE